MLFHGVQTCVGFSHNPFMLTVFTTTMWPYYPCSDPQATLYIQFSVPYVREAVTTIISPSCFTIADLIATHPGFNPRGRG